MAVRPDRKPCKRCGAPKPPGQKIYCGDECISLARVEKIQRGQRKRMSACKRCGGEKELGVRGSKYCAECRRIIADVSTQYEQDRSRRRWIEKLKAGDAEGREWRRRVTDAPDGMKWCSRCQAFLPKTSFPKRNTDRSHAAYCRPCQKSYNSERRLVINFGLTADEYDLLLATQDYRCAICEGKPRKYLLAVDHDHQTGEIRGLLCSRCNHRLLGAVHDSAARLRKAADYLESFTPREVFGEARHVPGFTTATTLVRDAGYGDTADEEATG